MEKEIMWENRAFFGRLRLDWGNTVQSDVS